MSVKIKNISDTDFTIDDWGTSITFPPGVEVLLSDKMSSRKIMTSTQLTAKTAVIDPTTGQTQTPTAIVIIDGQASNGYTYQSNLVLYQSAPLSANYEGKDTKGVVAIDGENVTSKFDNVGPDPVARYITVTFTPPAPLIPRIVTISYTLPDDFSTFKRSDTVPAGHAVTFYAKAFVGVATWQVVGIYDTNGLFQALTYPAQTAPVRTQVTVDSNTFTGTYEGGKICTLLIHVVPLAPLDCVGFDTDNAVCGTIPR